MRAARIRRSLVAEQRGDTITLRGVNKRLHPIAKIGLESVEWEENMRRTDG